MTRYVHSGNYIARAACARVRVCSGFQFSTRRRRFPFIIIVIVIVRVARNFIKRAESACTTRTMLFMPVVNVRLNDGNRLDEKKNTLDVH